MLYRFAVAALLLVVTSACGQSSSPSTTAPTPSCAYSLSIGDTINGYPAGGNFSVGVTTTPATGCAWTAVSNASWLHITNPGSGSGNGTFAFAADANSGPARSGTLTAAGRLITFNQSAHTSSPTPPPTNPSCAFTLSIGNTINGYPDGGTFSVGITNTEGSNCAWTSVSFASWLHVTEGASGTGTGTTTFVAEPNHDETRTGMLVIAGQSVTFRQTGR